MIEPTGLMYLRAVVDAGSILAAAEDLTVAASAISRQIAQLEHELGVSLFDRHPRGMAVTPAGRTVYDHAVRVHDDTRLLRAAVARGHHIEGEVRIAAVEGVLHALLPGWIKDVLVRHPRLELVVTQRSSAQVVDALASGEADLGFVFGPAARADLVTLATMPMPVQLAVREDHPLAGLDTCSLEALADFRFVLPDASFGIRTEVERAFIQAGVALRSALETNSLLYATELTDLTGLPTFTTAEIVQSAGRSSSLRLVPLDDLRLSATGSTLVSRAGALGPVQSAVRDELRQLVVARARG